MPFNLVVLYSGLQNIPADMYEAASLDGAGSWRQFWSITLPLLRPVTAITLLLGLIYTLKVGRRDLGDDIGGARRSIDHAVDLGYKEAFGTGMPAFSPAAAVGNLLILIALVFGFLHLRLQNRQGAGS